jgi:KaiC/GvpD/RAD55 family RecA-like ATPase
MVMTKVQKLENEVQQLNPDELAAFRDWFRKYDSDEWDKEIERDVSAGRLDKLAEEAIAAHKAGRTREI